MNDYKKMLDFLVYDHKNKNESYNLLIENIIEYLHSILECLLQDLKTQKANIVNQNTIKFLENMTDKKITVFKCKCALLSVNYKRWMVLKFKDVLENDEIQEYINSSYFYKSHKIKMYDLKGLHSKICKDMFSKIENSYEYGDEVWIGVASEEESEFAEMPKDNIRVEIISSDILAYDRYILDALKDSNSVIRDYFKELYRPYIIEYYISMEKLGENQKKFISKMHKTGGWYKAALTKQDVFQNVTNEMVFNGVFVHSASPVQYSNRTLIIKDENIDCSIFKEIEETYDTWSIKYSSSVMIQDELGKIFNDVVFRTAKIYKVGDGNCIYCHGKKGNNRRRFFYDIGFDLKVNISPNIRYTEKKYRAAMENIIRAKPHCIILSHWDEDHYRGCVYAKKDLFYTRWIAPNIDVVDKKINAKRLFLYLYMIGSLMVVDRKKLEAIKIKHSDNAEMTLFIGRCKSRIDNKITKCNREGIAVYIENKYKNYKKIRCMMQGDVPYMSLPVQADFINNNPYDYLVVPHHGAAMDCSLLNASNRTDGQAVISCSGDINAGRPEQEHLESLTKSYSDVFFTENTNSFIEINLTKKHCMNRK